MRDGGTPLTKVPFHVKLGPCRCRKRAERVPLELNLGLDLWPRFFGRGLRQSSRLRIAEEMSASPTEEHDGTAQKRKNDDGVAQPRAKRNRYISIAW